MLVVWVWVYAFEYIHSSLLNGGWSQFKLLEYITSCVHLSIFVVSSGFLAIFIIWSSSKCIKNYDYAFTTKVDENWTILLLYMLCIRIKICYQIKDCCSTPKAHKFFFPSKSCYLLLLIFNSGKWYFPKSLP